MAQYLYPGCDVWLNNPLRPFEACGTSGMKAALNGGLNLSILDGWWDEWYDGENGWAIPTADGVEDPDRRDDLEAAALYDLIENSVAPRFYDRDDARAAAALARDGDGTRCRTLGPKVLATRMVARLRRASSTCPAAAPAGRSTARSTPARSVAGGLQGRGACAPWSARAGRPRRVAPASATRRRWATSCRCGRSCRSGELRRDDVEVQVVHGRVSPSDTSRTSRRRRCSTSRPTRRAGTGSRATSGCAAPARSATPCGCCRTSQGMASARRARAGRQRLTRVRLQDPARRAHRARGSCSSGGGEAPGRSASRTARLVAEPGQRCRRTPAARPRSSGRGRPAGAAAWRRGRAARRRCPTAAGSAAAQGGPGSVHRRRCRRRRARTTSSDSSTCRPCRRAPPRAGTSAACAAHGSCQRSWSISAAVGGRTRRGPSSRRRARAGRRRSGRCRSTGCSRRSAQQVRGSSPAGPRCSRREVPVDPGVSSSRQ